MRIGIIADCHIGNHRVFGGSYSAGINTRCRLSLEVLESVFSRAIILGCESLCILGDLFDTVNPSPQIITEVQRIIKDVPSYILLGNHEQVSAFKGDHSLGPLSPLGRVIDSNTVVNMGDTSVIFIPFHPGPASSWLPNAVDNIFKEYKSELMGTKYTTLMLHLGIADGNTPAFLCSHGDVINVDELLVLCEKYGITSVFAGNWHWHKQHSLCPFICQVGTLCPTGFDNIGTDHGQFIIYDTDTNDVSVETICGPRFYKFVYGDSPIFDKNCTNYIHILADKDDVINAQDWAKTLISSDIIENFRISIHSSTMDEDISSVIEHVGASKTLEESIYKFVAKLEDVEDSCKAEITSKARDYLNIG